MADLALKHPIAARPIHDVSAWDRLKVNRNWIALWFMLPAAAFLLLFLAYPLGLGVWLSFTDARIGRLGEFIGLENYEWLWDDSVFWLSVFNTLLYTCVASACKFAVGLYLALLLNHNMPFKAIIRALVLIPFIVPTVLSAIAFWWIYDSQFSIVSWSLRKIGLIASNIDFLGDTWNARWSVIFANIWRGVPFIAITLLAGLQTVAKVSLRHLPVAHAHHRGGDDVFGAVYLHRFPAHLGAHARRPRERHASDGDARVPACHRRRLSRRGGSHRHRHDPVPARRHPDLVVRTAAAEVAARRKQ